MKFKFGLLLLFGFLVSEADVAKERDLIAKIQYGRYLFKISSCKDCHTVKNGQLLAGGDAIESPFGTFYGPNITADVETGIGGWTDEDFIRALRSGVSPAGRNYYPLFPFNSYSKLSDSDLLSLKAFIFSLPPVKKVSKNHEIPFPYNVREFISVWKLRNFQTISNHSEQNFIKARGPFQLIPTRDWEWNRGAYLVEGALHCTQCHTPRTALGDFKWDQWMGGSKISGSKKGAPNITQSKRIGMGLWTASDWETFLSEGISPNGSAVSGKMGKVIEDSTSVLSRTDMRAVIKYLMSLSAVETTEVGEKRD